MKKLLLLSLFLPILVTAQEPEKLVHNDSSYVDDYANVFSAVEERELDGIIRNFFDTVEISVVTIKTFGNIAPEDYRVRLHRHFGVGKKSNNGLLFIIGVDDRHSELSVGTGLEGDIPDITAKQLQQQYAKPAFIYKRYFEGTRDLLKALTQHLSPSAKEIRKQQEFKQKEISKQEWEKTKNELWNIFLGVLVLGVMCYLIYKGLKRIKKIKAEKKAYEQEVENVKNTLSSYLVLVQEGRLYKMPEAETLSQKISGLGAAKGNDMLLRGFYATPFYDAKKIEDTSNIIRKARDIIRNGESHITFQNKLEEYAKQIAHLVIDETNYIPQMQTCQDKIAEYKLTRIFLGDALKDYKVPLIKTFVSNINSQIHDITTCLSDLSRAITNDDANIKTASKAKEWFEQEIKKLRGYCIAVGVSNSTGSEESKRLDELTIKLKGFGVDPKKNYALYRELLPELQKCGRARTEHEVYLATEKRKAEAKRRDEQRIAEQNAYSSPYSSSDNNSSSDFGGGTTSGGGAGNDW